MRRSGYGQSRRPHIWLLTCFALLSVAALWPLTSSHGQAPHAIPGCESTGTDAASMQKLINAQGLKEFANPPEPASPPTSDATRLDLTVDYSDISVLGCPAKLRTYNKMLVGPTIRAKPGDTIHVRLINKLPVPDTYPPHPQQPEPGGHGGHGHRFSFNITNLHTHGLNVAPQGPVDHAGKVPFESDNVLLELGPGEQQDYRIQIHADHPAGTFWYHAHVHGSTAVQLSSGMAGALIIEGGTRDNGDLDTVPVIGQVKNNQKIFLLQQLAYDETGTVEKFNFSKFRPTLINGQLAPVIRMRPGEVQRWRFIHGGVVENVALALDGHAIHEVAADGITLGRSVPWAEAPASNARADNTLFLAPGYRSDVLVKARKPEPGHRYFLRKLALQPPLSIQAQERAFVRAAGVLLPQAVPPIGPGDLAPGQILAELVIEGPEISDQYLPGASELAGLVPKDHPDITQAELDASNAPQRVDLNGGNAICNAANGLCTPCDPNKDGPNCRFAFQVKDRQFSLDPSAVRTLKLYTAGKPTAAEWKITTSNFFHPFHIHVNPFQLDRSEPDATGAIVQRTVWKDTILIQEDKFPSVRMRYLRFTGKFVLHCHILTHEDQGMMQLVEITD